MRVFFENVTNFIEEDNLKLFKLLDPFYRFLIKKELHYEI